MFVCQTIALESIDVGSSYLQGIRVKFVYEGHRVNIKVTGAQKVNFCSSNVKFWLAITSLLQIIHVERWCLRAVWVFLATV